ncbi:MAG: hypothetical protein IPI66_12580 [Chitinophagaceae bacterium]|nr:hypothetical protein [Chitinophagaceae bacterium]MBL0056396.1 hypothetical protein [Chitinophagaceae bacterium]
MHRIVFIFLILAGVLFGNSLSAQKINDPKKQKKNTSLFSKPDPNKLYNPRIATYRSAILPGWGQVTNKKAWKVPIVYAALGITTYIFIRNVNQFNEAKRAYANSIDGDPSNDYQIPQPYFSVKDQPERIKSFRNQVRQNVDYSALFFILFWGLNVVDAAVDANLKTFDVSDDLSLQIRPGYSPLANTNGISLVMRIGKDHSK